MTNLDKVNLIGRIFMGLYFLFTGISIFQSSGNAGMETWLVYLMNFLAFWMVIGGPMLTGGIKPRAVAGVMGITFIIWTIVEFSFLTEINLQSTHIFDPFAPNSASTISNWASQYIHLFISKIAIIGACMFVAGARKIPHGLMVRSESNMQEKYGM